MKLHKRRQFLQALGLSAVATPLAYGLGQATLSRAFADSGRRRIAIVVALGEAWPIYNPHSYIPSEFSAGGESYDGVDSTSFTWPSLLKGLAAHRDNIVIVDGFDPDMNKQQANHGYKYALFSGLGDWDLGNKFADVLGPTVDQHLAAHLQADAPLPSVLCGMEDHPSEKRASTFASGANRPLAHYGSAATMRTELLGGPVGESPSEGAAPSMRGRIIDIAREDISRLRSGLAGPERAMMDDYEAALLAYDAEQAALAEKLASCDQSSLMPGSEDPRTAFTALARTSLFAVNCGLTNVLGLTIGNGHIHDDLKVFGNDDWGKYPGHGGQDEYGPFIQNLFDLVFTEIGLMIDVLSAQADLTVFVMAANGATPGSHHANGARVPALIYDNSGSFRTGGRYYRLDRPKRYNAVRHTSDLLTTLAHGCGAPVARFNDQGEGPVEDLLT